MEIVSSLSSIRSISRKLDLAEQRIGFVPTMGALHEGHLGLIRQARRQTDKVLVSIFVNPTQFGPNEDYLKYPRDLARDAELAESAGADYVFAPQVEDLYPPGASTYITVEGLSSRLCGQSRPGHFRGVTTVVAILFNIVQPHVAFFGQKDFQQTVVIKQMARDLRLNVEIVIGATVREKDGLALSSRNAYLSPAERQMAPLLFRSLQNAQALVRAGEKNVIRLLSILGNDIAAEPMIRLDYVQIVDGETLESLDEIGSSPAVLAIAAFIGQTRLIDNIILNG